MFSKRLGAIALAGAASIGLLGCGASATSPGAAGQITIQYAHWGSNSEAQTVASMIQAFEAAHPEIKIEDNWIQSDYIQKILTSVAGGEAPAVIQVSNNDLPDLAQAFTTVEVDPAKYFTPNAPNGMKFDGKYYAVPFVIKPKVMSVNLAAFEKAGIAAPSLTDPMSIDTFVEDAKKITGGSGDDKVWGSAPLWYNGFLTAFGGTFFATDGSCTINTPAAKDAAKLLIEAQGEGGFAPTSLDAQGQDMFFWLSVGKLGMQPDFGPWDIAKLASLDDKSLQIVPVPGKGSQLEVNGLAISATASDAEKAAATTFVNFMSTDDRAQSRLTTRAASLGVPITAGGLKAFYEAAPNLNLKAFEVAAGQSELGASVKHHGDITGSIGDALNTRTAMGEGTEDPGAVLDDLQSKCPDGLIRN
jgi:ABC-type glycerol-3-phosphate transport system substrate-binding protein